MSAAADDPRWDSPLFSWWRAGHPDRLPRRRHDGTEERWGYPRAWERCPSCRGTGRLRVAADAEAEALAMGRSPDVANYIARVVAQHEESNPLPPCPFCHGTRAIKHLVRELAGHRCIRCGHPYRVGQEAFWDEPPELAPDTAWQALRLFVVEPTDEPRVKRARPVHWSPCDARCTHGGPVRWRSVDRDVAWRRDRGPAVREMIERGWEVQAAYRILTVHHLNEDKGDCRWWNLAALCQRCHLTIQGKVQMDRVWPYEHSEWFRPYVAGFYAWRYEGVSPSRREVEARMDELLAYERA